MDSVYWRIVRYVYDENSNLYQPIENYKSYLEGLGVDIKEARLSNYNATYEYGSQDEYYYSTLCSTSYWGGDADNRDSSFYYVGVTLIPNMSGLFPYMSETAVGVRPIIII